ncbi:glycosyltransferase family 87 protein [Humibacter ginsenosidimutans]|uniref:DUF2029 domain-containing protein n=1 Tax=Humibacter ginsenosidimutans TaxID=2599293 RepID=A0A5B8M5E4_9MICO|nr:glycosyltransferase family 87 protein [Humibacter ginsenosidimutans]QDZ14720.1 DUF2029 domain-containing protein [Humibacter ginsenosidimutans]
MRSDAAQTPPLPPAQTPLRASAPARYRARLSAWVKDARRSRTAVWVAFALVHLGIAAVVLPFGQFYLGDVHRVYLPWAMHAIHGHGVVGIDTAWVYPIGALVPVLLPALAGASAYGAAWMLMVTALDAVAVVALTARGEARRMDAAWWWLAFVALLGPIALTRLDTVSVPIAMLALLWLATRPRTAVALLTIATWIKVWPAALLLAVLVCVRSRARTIIVALTTSAAIVAMPVLLGAGGRLFSFIGTQDSRGLQVEAPVSTVWMWAAVFHLGGARIFYDKTLNTFQVTGDGSHIAASMMTPVLLITIIGVAALGTRAAFRRDERALPVLALALVLAFMLFDKVLSPQYIPWLAAPVVYGLVQQPHRFRFAALLTLAIAAATQAFYPWAYRFVLAAEPLALGALLARNVALCVLFGWSVVRLWRGSSAPVDARARPTQFALVDPAA